MTRLLRAAAAAFRSRIEDKALAHGLIAPWWLGTTAVLAFLGSALVAIGQRDALTSPVVLVVPAMALPYVAQLLLTRWVPWWVDAGLGYLGLAGIAATTLVSSSFEDFLPIAAAFLVAHVTASDGVRAGAVSVTGGVLVALVLPSSLVLDTAPVDAPTAVIGVLEIALGATIGFFLRSQMRALAAERAARLQEAERAALAERQRIAREIHDLVAHSLSVTMLHVTGARQVLLDGLEDAVPSDDAAVLHAATTEASDALAEAEQVGRQAMADIRRTVGLLARAGTDPDGLRALPDARDIGALLAQVRGAGQEVDAHVDGDLALVPPALGLGLYRVLQESLANASRHAPGAAVSIALAVAGSGAVRLRVENAVRRGAAVGTDGSGTQGMAARIAQLGGSFRGGRRPGTGGEPDRWVVEVRVPGAGCPVAPVVGAVSERLAGRANGRVGA